MSLSFRHPAALLALLILVFSMPTAAVALDNLDSRYVTLEPIVVNMESPDRARYLRTSIQLEAVSAEDARSIREHIPAVRDCLIRVLGGRAPDRLRDSGDREALREQALVELNEVLEELTGASRVGALYFSDFIRQ